MDKKPDSVFPLWVLSFTERKIGSNLVKASKIALLSGKLLAQSRSDAAHAALLQQASDAQVRTPRAVSASPLLRVCFLKHCVVLCCALGFDWAQARATVRGSRTARSTQATTPTSGQRATRSSEATRILIGLHRIM